MTKAVSFLCFHLSAVMQSKLLLILQSSQRYIFRTLLAAICLYTCEYSALTAALDMTNLYLLDLFHNWKPRALFSIDLHISDTGLMSYARLSEIALVVFKSFYWIRYIRIWYHFQISRFKIWWTNTSFLKEGEKRYWRRKVIQT